MIHFYAYFMHTYIHIVWYKWDYIQLFYCGSFFLLSSPPPSSSYMEPPPESFCAHVEFITIMNTFTMLTFLCVSHFPLSMFSTLVCRPQTKSEEICKAVQNDSATILTVPSAQLTIFSRSHQARCSGAHARLTLKGHNAKRRLDSALT